jgi:hypothetical protein
MKKSEAFPSKYLSAADLNGKDVLAVMAEAEYAMLNDERKPILSFQSGKTPDGKFIALKPMVLNKTNFQAISNITGSDETEDWAGREIVLISSMVDFQGKSVAALRVRAPKGSAPPPIPQREKYELSSGNGAPDKAPWDEF